MKKRFLSLTLTALLAVSTMTGCGSSSDSSTAASDQETYVFKFASENVATHPRNIAMSEFFEPELEKRSDGRIDVQLFTDGVLGKESELIQMLPTAAIQGYRGAGYENLNPAFEIWSAPFVFEDYDEAGYFQTTNLARSIMDNVSDPNVYIPATGFTGFRQIVCKKEIVHPSDLAGVTMRAPNQNPILDFYKAVKASPQNMSAADAYMALQQGAIDGVCNPAASIDGFKYLEVADYLIEISYCAGADPFMVSAKWYNSLPDDLKEIFDEVAQETMEYSNELVAADDANVMEKCKEKAKHYVNIIDDPGLLQEWRDALTYVPEQAIARGTYTEEQYQELLDTMAAYREGK